MRPPGWGQRVPGEARQAPLCSPPEAERQGDPHSMRGRRPQACPPCPGSAAVQLPGLSSHKPRKASGPCVDSSHLGFPAAGLITCQTESRPKFFAFLTAHGLSTNTEELALEMGARELGPGAEAGSSHPASAFAIPFRWPVFPPEIYRLASSLPSRLFLKEASPGCPTEHLHPFPPPQAPFLCTLLLQPYLAHALICLLSPRPAPSLPPTMTSSTGGQEVCVLHSVLEPHCPAHSKCSMFVGWMG